MKRLSIKEWRAAGAIKYARQKCLIKCECPTKGCPSPRNKKASRKYAKCVRACEKAKTVAQIRRVHR